MARWGRPALAVLALAAVLPSSATPQYVDWCALDLPELVGGYANISRTLSPLENTNARIRNLLAGKTVRAVAHLDRGRVEHSTFDSVDGCADCPYPDVFFCAPHIPGRGCHEEGGLRGRDYEVFSAVAQRGGFEVEWAVTRDISATHHESYTPMAVNFTTDDRFDISSNWWTDTEERRKLGLVIGHHHTDASRVLVTHRYEPDSGLDLDLLLRPFAPVVWITFAACMSSYAVMMLFIDRPWWSDLELGRSPTWRFLNGLTYELWLSFERFNGGDHHSDPRTNSGRLLTSVYGLFTILFVSLYTAKLAAIIVVDDARGGGLIQSLEDIRDRGGQVLMFSGEPMKNRMISRHPYLRVAEGGTLGEMKTAKLTDLMTAHGAHAIILPSSVARAAVLQPNNCDAIVTSNIQISGGGFMASVRNCAANAHVVLDGLLFEIENDGTLDAIERRFENADQCSGSGDDSGMDNSALSMDQMFGLFAFIGGAMVIIFIGVMIHLHFTKAHEVIVTNVREHRERSLQKTLSLQRRKNLSMERRRVEAGRASYDDEDDDDERDDDDDDSVYEDGLEELETAGQPRKDERV